MISAYEKICADGLFVLSSSNADGLKDWYD